MVLVVVAAVVGVVLDVQEPKPNIGGTYEILAWPKVKYALG